MEIKQQKKSRKALFFAVISFGAIPLNQLQSLRDRNPRGVTFGYTARDLWLCNCFYHRFAIIEPAFCCLRQSQPMWHNLRLCCTRLTVAIYIGRFYSKIVVPFGAIPLRVSMLPVAIVSRTAQLSAVLRATITH